MALAWIIHESPMALARATPAHEKGRRRYRKSVQTTQRSSCLGTASPLVSLI